MLRENITTIVEEIYEISKANNTDIYYLHVFDEGVTLKYKNQHVQKAHHINIKSLILYQISYQFLQKLSCKNTLLRKSLMV